jgi:iron complex outermembrane receptor protein
MKNILTYALFLFVSIGVAQSTGYVIDDNNNPLPGASVVIKGTTTGSTTDFDGKFSINARPNDILVVSYVGFETQEVEFSQDELTIVLQEGVSLSEVLVTGNRSKPRTAIDSAVPIDNLKTTELVNTGEASIQRALTFSVPSFNAQDQPISDATAGFAPADLRGLGPSRTLVLINGKRVNQQAQAYLNRTPGKGEVGINLNSIPIAAVDRIEVLRDGASSQYGSDAMAGVINFILKKDTAFSTFNASTGITSEGDGFQFNSDFNTSLSIGDGGFLNLTLSYIDQEKTNRAGSPGVNSGDISDSSLPNEIKFAQENPKLGMIVGRPDLKQKNLLVNFMYPIGDNSEFYTTHSYSSRWNRSFAYYRFPGWRRDVAEAGFLNVDRDPEGGFDGFIGYHPTFEGDIQDHFNILGFDFNLGNDWHLDLSVTHGYNQIDYTVNRSVNRDYLKANGTSPTSFKPGGYAFSNIIENIDLSKSFNETISFSAGLEHKKETFEANIGDPFSRYGGGSDSFAGISADQEGKWDRNNFAIYSGLDIDISKQFLLAFAGRFEEFSDFGSNFSWKMASRYKISDSTAARASISTGFRAPSLHQRYLSNTQFIIVAGSPEPLLQGTLRNGSDEASALGFRDLFAEKSLNLTTGITFGNKSNFSGSLDLYYIRVNDRILLSSQISGEGNQSVQTLLSNAGVVSIQGWINAGNTNTKGLDIVLNWKTNNLNLGLAGNINETKINSIDTPEELKGVNIFTREEAGLIINSRPKYKFSLTADYNSRTFDIGFYNTLFGNVTVTAPESGGIDQVLSPKLTTDFRFTYKFTPQLMLTGIVNNIFDVYPDITLASTNTAQAGSRFKYSSEVQQQGQLGRNYTLGLSYKF